MQDRSLPGLVRRERDEPLPGSALVIFDGACGFCTWSVCVLYRPLGVRVHAIPYQWLSVAELAAFGTTRARCVEAVHFVDASRTPTAGADAVNALLRNHPFFGPPVALIARVPVLLRVERRAYTWLAANRVWISRLLGTRLFALIAGDTDS